MQIRTLADLAAAVRRTRKQRGLTQADLAKLAGVSRNWVISLESGTAGRAELGRTLDVLTALDLHLNLLPPTSGTDQQGANPATEDNFDLDAYLKTFYNPMPEP